MNLLKLADATKVIPIFMADSTNPIAGKPGLILTVQLSKNGGAFANAAGTVSELAAGHYYLTPTSADTGMLGPLVVKATASGGVDFAAKYAVVAFDPYSTTNLGLTNLDAAVSSRSTFAAGGNVNVATIANTTITVPSSGSIAFPNAIGTSTFAGGAVASVTAPVVVGTNNDKTGYNLTQAFPANFATLGITAAGKISGVVLTDTLTTYTGDTPQTGDAFARLGAPTGTSIAADIQTRSTFAAGGNVNVATIANATLTVPTSGSIAFSNVVGTSTYAGGPVAAVTAPVTVGTNNDKTGYSLTGNVTVGGYASGQDPATLVLDAVAANHDLPNTIGAAISTAAIPSRANPGFDPISGTGDPWAATLPGSYADGTAGAILGGWVDTINQLLPANFNALAITPGSGGVTIATNMDKSGYILDPSGLDPVPIESNVNARQALSPILAAAAGVVSGAGTGTITIKGGNVTDTRIKANTDKAGNRTAVTLTLPPPIIVSPTNSQGAYFPLAYFPTSYFPIGKVVAQQIQPA